MIEEYVYNLKKLFGCELSCYIYGDEVSVSEDNEVKFIYSYNKKKIYLVERGKKREIQKYEDDIFLQIQYALIISGIIEPEIKQKKYELYSEKESIDEIKELSKSLFSNKYYSIGLIENKKVSLICGKTYKVVFAYDGKTYDIGESEDKKTAFSVFGYAIDAYVECVNFINRYVKIFGVNLSDDDIIRFWGKPIGIV